MGDGKHGIHSVPPRAKSPGAGSGDPVHFPFEFGVGDHIFHGGHERVVAMDLLLRQGGGSGEKAGQGRVLRGIVSPGVAFDHPAGRRMGGYIFNSLPELENIGPELLQRSQVLRAGL
jgi:hypothetical protein